MKNKTIGGFFELETGTTPSGSYHPEAIALTSGRSCLSLALSHLKPTKIYAPYYICDAALTPCATHQVDMAYYEINAQLKPTHHISLQTNEYFIYVNYFGLMHEHIDELYEQYGDRLIIDNTQAFFDRGYKNCWSFNSCRKYFGVPDGGYLYSPIDIPDISERNHNIITHHLTERLLNQETAYKSYLLSEANVSSDILNMSLDSENLMKSIDYQHISAQRRNNFDYYANHFAALNQFKVSLKDTKTPFCYPLWLPKTLSREILATEGIFIPTLWRDTHNRHSSNYILEKQISLELLPLPIDHRYTETDCQRVIDEILLQATECNA